MAYIWQIYFSTLPHHVRSLQRRFVRSTIVRQSWRTPVEILKLRHYHEQGRDNDNSILGVKGTLERSQLSRYWKFSMPTTDARYITPARVRDIDQWRFTIAIIGWDLIEVVVSASTSRPARLLYASSTIFQDERTILKPVLMSKSSPFARYFSVVSIPFSATHVLINIYLVC